MLSSKDLEGNGRGLNRYFSGFFPGGAREIHEDFGIADKEPMSESGICQTEVKRFMVTPDSYVVHRCITSINNVNTDML